METTPVLSQDEKLFLDRLPNDAVKTVLENPDHQIKLSFVKADFSYTEYYEFLTKERADAVRDYFVTQIEYGIRPNPFDS